MNTKDQWCIEGDAKPIRSVDLINLLGQGAYITDEKGNQVSPAEVIDTYTQ